eukprot:791428-Pyramimonas_sp.AAC.1
MPSQRVQSECVGLRAAAPATRGAARGCSAPDAGLARARGPATQSPEPAPWAPALGDELAPDPPAGAGGEAPVCRSKVRAAGWLSSRVAGATRPSRSRENSRAPAGARTRPDAGIRELAPDKLERVRGVIAFLSSWQPVHQHAARVAARCWIPG